MPITKCRYITVETRGYIPLLGMDGPIVAPIEVPETIITNLVMRGYKLSEFNSKTKEKIQLTLENIYDNDRFKPKPEKPREKTPLDFGKLPVSTTPTIPAGLNIPDAMPAAPLPDSDIENSPDLLNELGGEDQDDEEMDEASEGIPNEQPEGNSSEFYSNNMKRRHKKRR